MKIALIAVIIISALFALMAWVSAGLTWGYFPSSAIGVVFYEFNDYIVTAHIAVVLWGLCCGPYTKSKKAMVVLGVIFIATLLINFGSRKYHIETETHVTIDSTSYRVSSLELPTIDIYHPYGPSPFKPFTGAIGADNKTQSLHFAPKNQFGYSFDFGVRKDEKFYIAIHSKKPTEGNRFEGSILVVEQNRVLEFYPEEPSDPQNTLRFHSFIRKNLADIKQDIKSRVVS